MSYQALADVYDLLMEDVDYQQWADYLQMLLNKNQCPGKRLLDLGCGTGSITIPLAQKGYQITAVDLSAEMLEQARRKSADLPLDIDWQQQDMADLQLYDENDEALFFDAAISTFDAFNYLTEPENLQYLLQSLSDCLVDDGLLIFDVQTPYKLREYLGNNIYTLHHPQVEYMWENHFDDEEEICRMDITFFIKQENGLYQRVTETHQERAYDLDLLQMWLQMYGLQVLGVYAELSEQPIEAESHRAVFVVRKLGLDEEEELL